MSEWTDLDVNQLPSDILVAGAYVWKMRRPGCALTDCPWFIDEITTEALRPFPKYIFSYRRPEGWEPKECPTCESPDKTNRRIVIDSASRFHGLCPNTWHDEPKAPTHEEIIDKSKFWSFDGIGWDSVVGIGYSKSLNHKIYYKMSNGTRLWASQFADRQSADIPPEESK